MEHMYLIKGYFSLGGGDDGATWIEGIVSTEARAKEIIEEIRALPDTEPRVKFSVIKVKVLT